MKMFLVAFAAIFFATTTAFAQAEIQDDVTQEELTQEEFNAVSEEEVMQASDRIESLQLEQNEVTMNKVVKMNKDFGHLDPKHLVPDSLLAQAVAYFQDNQSKIKNKKYLSVIDFSAHASKTRFFIINMASGEVQAFHTAHGSGSDKNNDGYAESFSNTSGSNASSLGFYMTAETYSGKHGYSLRLDGLSSTNSRVRARAVVVHGADYVKDGGSTKAGRSWGCPAVSMANRTKIIDMIKGGSVIFAGLSK